MRNKPKLYPPLDQDHETRSVLASELKAARMRGFPTSGWDLECLRIERSQTKREYNKRYRERHPERERATRRIYWARHEAKRRGLPQPPLPPRGRDPDKPVPQDGIEVPFDY
jgi:hypothetical protein